MTTLDPEMVTRAARGVYLLTARTTDAITYEVRVGDHPDGGDRADCRRVWFRTVAFGTAARTRAGGATFREAAREQAAVADAYAQAARPPEVTW